LRISLISWQGLRFEIAAVGARDYPNDKANVTGALRSFPSFGG
jgi:hypothetical protein